jgi:prophage regulatory protein
MANVTEQAETFRDLVADKQERIIRKQELLKMIGLSDATVWRKEREGTFPKRLKLGGNSCGWFESEINGWMKQLSAAREA